ncbi:MAG: restriction endonuclease subunit M [Planctomycetota bacterium]|nr:MAG: restriction endonuclease subunit M [Planctomycetota bacterium]
MPPLANGLRNDLETVVKKARVIAERGAKSSLEALTVHEAKSGVHLDAAGRELRARLRAHAKQLGDVRKPNGEQAIGRLIRECAYEHWHRMLFARFLAENDLLIHPEHNVSVSLDDVLELAREQQIDQWELASRFATRMLPQIFRPDDPVLGVALPRERTLELEQLLESLPADTFKADDSLGWVYQFWQAEEKDRVNASGEKITGEMLPAVTQLFTEHYMVLFLLHNTIGAWWAAKRIANGEERTANAPTEADARAAVALPDYAFEYLRFVRESRDGDEEGKLAGPWRPAAGTFDGWPRAAKDLKVLDPCCGSGHFLVAAFDLLVRLRMEEEGLSLEGSIRAVLADNLFGLELDARCTQIAAFNLALAGWRMVGRPIDLPTMNIACCGLGPHATEDEWLQLAEQSTVAMPTIGREPIRNGLRNMHALFSQAPELGALIDLTELPGNLIAADWETLQPYLAGILKAESRDEEAHERAVAAQGMAAAAEILAGGDGQYTLVITNVPYLGRKSHSDRLKAWADAHEADAKSDLATLFVARMLGWVGAAGTVAAVTPQNWLFLTSYRKLRERLLKERTWNLVARLGPGAFETIGGHVVNVALLAFCGGRPAEGAIMAGIDASAARSPADKARVLCGEAIDASRSSLPVGPGAALAGRVAAAGAKVAAAEAGESADSVASAEAPGDKSAADGTVRLVPQAEQLKNPDARILLEPASKQSRLEQLVDCRLGLGTGDSPHYLRRFWELRQVEGNWACFQNTSEGGSAWGYDSVVAWDHEHRRVHGMSREERVQAHNQDYRGREVWGRRGVAISIMSTLRTCAYNGQLFDKLVAVIVPHELKDLPAVSAYLGDGEFVASVRTLDQKVMVTNATLVKVPFDLAHWQNIAAEKYPHGLPEPQSNDPTQWLFHGHPAGMLAAGPGAASPAGIADPVGADRHPSLICRTPSPAALLQVAAARLVGYRWPAELDPAMRLDPAARAWAEKCAELQRFADDDGVVCIPSVRGERPAADRVLALLAACGLDRFKTGPTNLDAWLREEFFAEHCTLFHNRPFIWHIWDGRKDGFHALVNYHKLAGPGDAGRRLLTALTHSHLGDWIRDQKDQVGDGKPGAEARLTAALDLKAELEKILAGEPPYDIFVRWKPLREQPIGWEPDINDGVRLNIRPFLMARDVGRKGAGVLRCKPNIKWDKDRGKEPQSLRPKADFPWFWGCDPEKHAAHRKDFAGGDKFDGNRWNDLHYTNAFKQAARDA